MNENKEYNILVDNVTVNERDVDSIVSMLMSNVYNYTYSSIKDKEQALQIFNKESNYTWVDFSNYFKDGTLEFHDVALLDVSDNSKDIGWIYSSIDESKLNDYLYMLRRLKDIICRYNDFPNCNITDFITLYIQDEGFTFNKVDKAKCIIHISYKEITLHLDFNIYDECIENIVAYIDNSIVDIGVTPINID